MPAIRAGKRTSKAALGKEVPRQIRAGANARADTSTQQNDRTLVSTMGSSVLPMDHGFLRFAYVVLVARPCV